VSDRRLLLVVLSALTVIVVANNGAGSLAQPAIGQAFDAGPADVGWIVFGYSVSFAIATALWGGLARRFGLGPSLAAGVLLFSGASLAAVLAPSLTLLIAARIVQGAGSGAIPTLGNALIARRFLGGGERSRAFGMIVASVAVGMAIGPLIGGVALELAGWQGAVAFGIVALPTVVLFARLDSDREAGRRLDLVGAGLIAVTAVAAIVCVNRLPVLGITEVTIAALAILAIAAALLVRHSLGSEDAFIPRRVIHARAFQRVTILGAVGQSAFLGTIVLVPIGAAAAHGLTGLPLALVILPLAGTAAIVSLRNDRVQARIGRRATTTSALALLAGGAASVALLGAAASPVVMAFALLPIGAGFGLLGPPLMSELTEAFPPVDQPIAVGSFNLGFFLGGSLGASLATALVQSGATIPGFADRPLPGFTTAELLLAVGPAFAAVAIAVRDRRQRRRLEAPSIA